MRGEATRQHIAMVILLCTTCVCLIHLFACIKLRTNLKPLPCSNKNKCAFRFDEWGGGNKRGGEEERRNSNYPCAQCIRVSACVLCVEFSAALCVVLASINLTLSGRLIFPHFVLRLSILLTSYRDAFISRLLYQSIVHTL
jgi:hypothetical protein